MKPNRGEKNFNDKMLTFCLGSSAVTTKKSKKKRVVVHYVAVKMYERSKTEHACSSNLTYNGYKFEASKSKSYIFSAGTISQRHTIHFLLRIRLKREKS